MTRAGRSVRRGEEDYVNRAFRDRNDRNALIRDPRVVTEKVRDKHIIDDISTRRVIHFPFSVSAAC